jgi:hypothetical protein
MIFEGRELKPYAEPVSPNVLKEKEVYFVLQYLDEDCLIPIMEPMVFLGWEKSEDGSRAACFQTAHSYEGGVRRESVTDQQQEEFLTQPADQLNFIFDFEHALSNLMLCSLRRRGFTDN